MLSGITQFKFTTILGLEPSQFWSSNEYLRFEFAM